MNLSTLLAGIAWDPTIKGILVVAVGVAVLMGSVYLLLLTNLGHRLGFLLALSAFFGWMTILGLFWWIKPSATGPAGRVPSWEVEEINTGDLPQAELEDARDLDTSNLPDPDVINKATAEEFGKLAAEEEPQLAGWRLLAPSDPARGEAQAVVDETLTAGDYPGIDATSDYTTTYAFETGGKPERKSDSVFDRIANKVTNTIRITHPPHYAIVQVCLTTPESRPEAAEAGQKPPPLVCDQTTDTISVVLVRDLGERRTLPALITLISGMIFGLLCYMLHVRDRVVMEHRSAPLPAPTPTGG
ncbi:MAG TPA: hypothetical protein VGJ86_26150 [Acidimicrobiales bacterium]|jgi:hypothetical protein